MDNRQKIYLKRLRNMSIDEYDAEMNKEEYNAIKNDPAVRKEFKEMRAARMTDSFKRERLLDALYTFPTVLEYLTNIQSYRDLRSEQAWISIAIKEGENDSYTKSTYQALDKKRRQVHNRALKSFCKLIEITSPGCTRDNMSQGESFFMPRDETKGDLYDGSLMIPEEEPDGYGPAPVRNEMTTGMFQLLKFIELTPRGDWDKARTVVLERLNITKSTQLPDIEEFQAGLKKMTRGFGLEEPLEEDDFGIDKFDQRDNKFKLTLKSGRDSRDDR